MTVPAITAQPLEKLARIRHGFFMRQGGVSRGLYESLNCGAGSQDDPKAVIENRARVAQSIGTTPDRLLCLYQCHSSDVVQVTESWTAAAQPRADAMVTALPGFALGILTADCVPLLFADPEAGVIGAAHAGWKGCFGGVLEATVSAMEKLGAARERIMAALGPCIRSQSYEVTDKFATERTESDPDAAAFFTPGKKSGHVQFSLPDYVALRVRRLGLGEISDTGLDTCSDKERFFSYRRMTLAGEADYGRQISVISLK